MSWIIVLAGVLPALGLLAYLDHLDARRPQPRRTLRRVALAGVLASIPCILIEGALIEVQRFIHSPWLIAIYLALVAAVVEESAKLLCLRGWVWNRPEFDGRVDGIVYAVRAAVGFALIETFIDMFDERTAAAAIGALLVRALISVPGHAMTGGIIGYYAARRRFDGRGPGAAGGLLIAIAMHGSFDGALFLIPVVQLTGHGELSLPLLAVPVAVLVFGAVMLRSLKRRALRLDGAAGVAGPVHVPALA